MSVKRTYYDEEFKKNALSLSESIGISKASKDLGVNPANLRRWKRDSSSPNKGGDSQEDWKKKAKSLERENFYLRKINEVLKKSTAIFSQEKFPGSK